MLTVARALVRRVPHRQLGPRHRIRPRPARPPRQDILLRRASAPPLHSIPLPRSPAPHPSPSVRDATFLLPPLRLAPQISAFLTFAVFPMVMYDWPRDRPNVYQTVLVFSIWSWYVHASSLRSPSRLLRVLTRSTVHWDRAGRYTRSCSCERFSPSVTEHEHAPGAAVRLSVCPSD